LTDSLLVPSGRIGRRQILKPLLAAKASTGLAAGEPPGSARTCAYGLEPDRRFHNTNQQRIVLLVAHGDDECPAALANWRFRDVTAWRRHAQGGVSFKSTQALSCPRFTCP
jgi:hypothetical protein